MITVLADLHIHTALSPCASNQMLPRRIVQTAAARNLSMIAVCDHNSAANAPAVIEAARRDTRGKLVVVPGIEITTREEVHVLGLFPAVGSALSVGQSVLQTLPEIKSKNRKARDPDSEQWILDSRDRRTGSERRLLSAASTYRLGEAVDLIQRYSGLAVAAHVDRRAFSVLGQLGFFPEGVHFCAAEISSAGVARGRCSEFQHHRFPLISSSDSHFLEDIGCTCTALHVAEPSFAELALALQDRADRRHWIA